MNRTLWIWQFDQLETQWSQPPYAPHIAGQGFNRVAIKALDGTDWMATYDKDPDAVSGLEDLKANLVGFNKAGLAMDTWVVPTKDTWQQAIPIYKQILDAVPGRLILDMEPYAGFWGDESDAGPFLRTLHNAVAMSRLWLCYDPRRVDWLKSYYLDFAGTMPMIYDPAWLADVPARTGVPLEVVLSGDSSGQDWLTICRDARLGSEDGRTGFGVFRAPLLGLERLGVLRGLA